MRFYDFIHGDFFEYKYSITFDELLKRDVDITKKIYVDSDCISQGNSTKSKADYIVVNPILEMNYCSGNGRVIFNTNECSISQKNIGNTFGTLFCYSRTLALVNAIDFHINSMYDCLKRFVYFTNEENVINRLVLDQIVSEKQSCVKLDNEKCKRLIELCQNDNTINIGLEMLANCYMSNLPLTCIILARIKNKIKRPKTIKARNLIKTMCSMKEYDGYYQVYNDMMTYSLEVCKAFNKLDEYSISMLNRMINTNNTLNEILDEWD